MTGPFVCMAVSGARTTNFKFAVAQSGLNYFGVGPMEIKLLCHINADDDLVEAWLKWYMRLGVTQFHLVVHGPPTENARILELAKTYPVVIEDTYEGPFHTEEKRRRLNAVLSRFSNQWVVVADSDEFLELPYPTIAQTIEKLEFARANVLLAPMLQHLKADGTVDSPDVINDPFQVFPVCSENLYEKMGSNAYLPKHPLFFCSEKTELADGGNHQPRRGSEVQTSAMRGVTHHFKFRRTVWLRLERMVQNKEHPWRHESVQYREYLAMHANHLPLEDSFPYSRDELFRRRLLRKLSLRNKIKSIGRTIGVVH